MKYLYPLIVFARGISIFLSNCIQYNDNIGPPRNKAIDIKTRNWMMSGSAFRSKITVNASNMSCKIMIKAVIK